MLGNKIKDPYHIEGSIEEFNGLGLLDLETVMDEEKTMIQYSGRFNTSTSELLNELDAKAIKGYEIHQGATYGNEISLTQDNNRIVLVNKKNIIATYLHGIFDNKDFTDLILNKIRERKGLEKKNTEITYEEYKISQYDKLEKIVRENINIDEIYKIINDFERKK